jgi:hypothetical protein
VKVIALTHPGIGIRYLTQIKTMQDLGIDLICIAFGGPRFTAGRFERQFRILRRKGLPGYLRWRAMRRAAEPFQRNAEECVERLWSEGRVRKPHFDIRHTFDGFASAAIRFVEREKPDYLYQVGAGLIPASFIREVPPILNLHPAILPGVRGLESVFWTHYYGLEECLGSTLHLIDENIDTGKPLLRRRFGTPRGAFYAESIKTQILVEAELLKKFFANPKDCARHDMGGSAHSLYRSFWSREQYLELQAAGWWGAKKLRG